MPDWSDRSPADPAVMLVELFAALGDRLAYWQDAVAVEAYLGTARRRTSVRRHARLLNYAVHEGCSARTLLALTTDSDLVLPASTPVTDLVPDPREGATLSPGDAADLGGTVFETCVAVPLSPERNALPLYAWGDADHCLLPGTTAAFVSTPSGVDPSLQAGDLLAARRPARQRRTSARRPCPPLRRTAGRRRSAPRRPPRPVRRRLGAEVGSGGRPDRVAAGEHARDFRRAGRGAGQHRGGRPRGDAGRGATGAAVGRGRRRVPSPAGADGPVVHRPRPAHIVGSSPAGPRPPPGSRRPESVRRSAHLAATAGPAGQRSPRHPCRRRARAWWRQPAPVR